MSEMSFLKMITAETSIVDIANIDIGLERDARYIDAFNKHCEYGEKEKLVNPTLRRYAKYMAARWADEVEMQIKTQYAKEWVDRFRSGSEFLASDALGKVILLKIYGGII